jgi:REP element-mobilizing transposase RayT
LIGVFKGRTSKALNDRIDRKGKLWQPAFFDHALRKEENIQQVARYIVANPLRAGLVENIEDYPHWDAIWL